MNDDYDNYIIQKYRLAVAVAIIKSTPTDSTPKQYLKHIKNKILKMDPYDPDMTICEDDFNINDNDDNIDKNKNEAINDLNNETQLFDSQTNDSITILKDFDFNNMIQNMNDDKDIAENNSVSDVLRILREVDNDRTIGREDSYQNVDDNNKLNFTRSTYYESSQSLQTNYLINENMEQTAHGKKSADTSNPHQYDLNNEVISTIKLRNEDINTIEQITYNTQVTDAFHEYTDHFTHISQSQSDNMVVPRYLIQKAIPKDIKSKLPKEQINKHLNTDDIFDNDINGHKIEPQIRNTKLIVNNIKQVKENKKHKYATQDTVDNIQAKRLKNNDSHINSNTDTVYFNEIKNKFNMNATDINSEITLNYDFNKRSNEIVKNLFIEQDKIKDSLQDVNDKFDFYKSNKELGNDQRSILDNIESQTSVESTNKRSRILYNSETISQPSQEFNSEAIEAKEINLNPTKEKTVTEESEEEQIIEDLFDKLTDSQAEVIPFKVLEELNKIKSYLNKRNKTIGSDCVSDSGYKSDSQSRSSFKSALQSSNIWLNQSAHCLLSFLCTCPLAVNTEDIINDISKTLGRLIDRLHEDEKYPSFLDKHLQTIDSLLTQIYEQESADKLLEKDESIYRLFLLNKSSHIIKYTTEKIINILEDLTTILTKEELLETSRPIQAENLSYVFHILETLIKKLVIYTTVSSQHSTQNSQEDDATLKKSSITDIWRKKWNPTKKTDRDPITSTKQCILVRCSDVLNKVIVEAMDGYSLISYFALQCFNLLQN